jgi:hypothetical protein
LNRRGVFLGLGLTSLVIAGAACSSDGGTGVTAPSPAPSGVVLGTLGNISCTAPDNPVPGTYSTIETNGTVANNTYTGNQGYNSYATNAFTAPNGGSPAPTPMPVVIPSVPPNTPGAVLWIVYYGEYTIPTTAGFSTAPTNGCLTLYTANIDQSVESGSRGVLTGTPAPSPSPFIAQGLGSPMFAPPYPAKSPDILDGDITAFTINNLTRTSGTGTFTLNTNQVGEVTSVSGTATITGSVAFYVNENGDNSYSFKHRVQSTQGGIR